MKELGNEYEALRAKQKSGAELTETECNRLQALTKEYKNHSSAMRSSMRDIAQLVKENESFLDKTKESTNSAFLFAEALSGAAAIGIAKFSAALVDVSREIVNLGLQTQNLVSHLNAMSNNLAGGAMAYQAFNDVARNTNYDFTAVYNMGKQLMNMGYSAKNAADLIQLCSDTSAALGQDVSGAQKLVEAISRIQSTGRVTREQLASLQMAGLDLDKAFAPLGMDAQTAMNQLKAGTLDGQTAIQALTAYMHQFDGKMAESKQNITDLWGDVTGNVTTACGEIGASISEAFTKSQIVQDLIDFTQSFVDLVRADGCGAFSLLGEVAEGVLSLIGDALSIVYSTVKLAIIGFNKLGEAVSQVCEWIYEKLQFILEPLGQIVSTLGRAAAAVGKSIKEGIDNEFAETFKAKVEVVDTGNNFRQRALPSSTVSTGGGAAAVNEEAKAVDALIEKYANASALAKERGEILLQIAGINASMMTGEAQQEAERINALAALEEKHNSVLAGYQQELALAQQITEAGSRQTAIDEINKQIAAQNQLYEAQVKAVNFKAIQTDAKDIIDRAFGDPESLQEKIANYKTMLTDFVNEIANIEASGAGGTGGLTADSMAQDMSEEGMSFLQKMLKMTPEQLAEEFEAKQTQFTNFADFIINKMAEATAAETENLSVGEKWAKQQDKWVGQIGNSMGTAVAEWISGSKSIGQAMKDMTSQLLQEAASLLSKWLSVAAVSLIWHRDPKRAAADADRIVLGLAKGGYVQGVGTGTSDSIPAMLSNGEYVVNAAAVRSIGIGNMEAINEGYLPKVVQSGGASNVNASFNMYGNVNNTADLDDMWSDFNDMLVAGIRGAG